MKIKFLLTLILLPLLAFSQNLKRTVFDYDKLKSEGFIECNENINKELEFSHQAMQNNNSAQAVKIAKKVYDMYKDCHTIYEIYGYALFRNGEWFEGIEIIEKGIKKLGSVPELIKKKSEMSLEMAQLGTKQKNIDGNSVYKNSSFEYNEEQFIEENLRSALVDLEYLLLNYKRNEDAFYIAKIYQLLKNYDKSTETFKTLLNDIEYKDASIFGIAENYLAQDKFAEAEMELNKLLAENPKSGQLYDKLAGIYQKKQDKEKAKEFKNKAIYYKNTPKFCDIEYSKENFELLKFFGTDDNKSSEKIDKLNKILKQNKQEYTIDICLIILKLHGNHGNGVEERATEILAKIGKPAIEKVNKLFQSDVSTCTITNLADVMATVKEDTSWELMKQYLHNMSSMPSTLIPPNLPEKMVKFNENNGIKEILLIIKPLLNQDSKSDDKSEELIAGFGQYVYYSALENISKSTLKKIATVLNYSEKEFKQLEAKLKK